VESLEGLYVPFFASAHLELATAIHVYDRDADDARPEMLLAERFRLLAGRLTRLEELDFDACGLTDVSMDELADADFPTLRTLDLSNCLISDAGVIALLNAGLPQRLTRLALDGNPVGDQSAFELADRLGKVSTFRWLEFRRTRVTNAGQAALTAAFGSRCNLF
jgi:Ran GTPase-activating protein (RanGAP) involved in mRNA processing and transport